ncbi:MAG: peptidoglycan-binding protein [Polyangiales bacterium]
MKVQALSAACSLPVRLAPSTLMEQTQAALLELGGRYATLTADGEPGPETAEAIAHFQEGHGLAVTGQLDGETVARIQRELEQSRRARSAADHSPVSPPSVDALSTTELGNELSSALARGNLLALLESGPADAISRRSLRRIEDACNFVHGERGANPISDALEHVGLSPSRREHGLRRLLNERGTPNLFISARRLRRSGGAEQFAQNLSSAMSEDFADAALIMSLLQREGGWARGVGGGRSSEPHHYHSFDDGGMDELWRIRNATDSNGHRYFPETVVQRWARDEFLNPETGETSVAARIPRRQEGGYLVAMTGYVHWARDAKVLQPMAEVLGEAQAEANWNDADIGVQRTWEAFAFARPGRARRAALEVARTPELELSDLLSEGDFRDRMNVDGALSRAMHSAAEAHAIEEMTR